MFKRNKSKRNPDLDLITGEHSVKFSFRMDNVAKTVTHKFIVEKGNDKKEFDPIQYLPSYCTGIMSNMISLGFIVKSSIHWQMQKVKCFAP